MQLFVCKNSLFATLLMSRTRQRPNANVWRSGPTIARLVRWIWHKPRWSSPTLVIILVLRTIDAFSCIWHFVWNLLKYTCLECFRVKSTTVKSTCAMCWKKLDDVHHFIPLRAPYSRLFFVFLCMQPHFAYYKHRSNMFWKSKWNWTKVGYTTFYFAGLCHPQRKIRWYTYQTCRSLSHAQQTTSFWEHHSIKYDMDYQELRYHTCIQIL